MSYFGLINIKLKCSILRILNINKNMLFSFVFLQSIFFLNSVREIEFFYYLLKDVHKSKPTSFVYVQNLKIFLHSI